MEELNLENLQNWVDEISPIKIDLLDRETYILSKVEPGIAGRVRTVLDNGIEYACLSTFNYEYEQGKINRVEIRFGYVNFKTNQTVKKWKWFNIKNTNKLG